MNSLRLSLLLSSVLVACGTDLVEPTTGVTSSALSVVPVCDPEKKARDAAEAALMACLTRQMEEHNRGYHWSCAAEELQLRIAEVNLSNCRQGSSRRIRCGCELPDLKWDGGRRYHCSGADGGCLNPDGGVDGGSPHSTGGE